MPTKRTLTFIALGALFAMHLVFVVDLPQLMRSTLFYIFQTRDLERALALIEGRMIFFGPEMTGGGNLPGPFYYFLLASGLIFDPSWQSAWYLLILLGGAATVAGAVFFYRRYSLATALVWASAFNLAVYPRRLTRFFLNTSYLLPFGVFIIIGICTVVLSKNPRAKRIAFLTTCLLTGLSLQLHFTAVCFMIALAFIHLFADKLRVESVDRRTFLWGLAAFAAPALPYLFWRTLDAFGVSVGQANSYAGAPEQAPGVLLHLMGYIASTPWKQIFSDALFSTLLTVPLFFFPLALTFWFARWKERERAAVSPLLRCLAVAALVGFFPFAYWYFAIIGFRYGVPFFLPVLFASCLLFHWLTLNRAYLKFYNLGAGALSVLMILIWNTQSGTGPGKLDTIALFMVVAIPVAIVRFFSRREAGRGAAFLASLALTLFLAGMQKNLSNVGRFVQSQPTTMPTLQQWTRILKKIHANTGWDYEQTVRRLYFINHHLEQDAKLIFDQAVRETPLLKNLPRYDGFFVSITKAPANLSRREIRSWLLEQNIQRDIKQALARNQLFLATSLDQDMLILPYRVRNAEILPDHFHNYGRGYSPAPEEGFFSQIPEAEGTKEVQPGIHLFKWNHCPDRHAFCSVGALVNLTGLSQKYLDITVFGSSISQVTPWVSPQWTELLAHPYLKLSCANGDKTFEIASSIGYARRYSGTVDQVLLRENNSFVGPFERRFWLENCDYPIHEIQFGVRSVHIETVFDVKRLPGRATSLSL